MVASNTLYLALLTGSLAGQAVATPEVEERGVFSAIKNISGGAKKIGAATSILNAGAGVANAFKKPSRRDVDELDERDFEEFDERDLEELEERGVFSAIKNISGGAKKIGAATSILNAGAGVANAFKKPSRRDLYELDERDFDELDERDLEELEERGVFSAIKNISGGAKKIGAATSILNAGAGVATAFKKPSRRDLYELDERDLEDIDELVQRSLAGNLNRGGSLISAATNLISSARASAASHKAKPKRDLDERDLEYIEELVQRSLAGNLNRGGSLISAATNLISSARASAASHKAKPKRDLYELDERDFDELDERDFEDFEDLVLREDDEEEVKPKKSKGRGHKGKGKGKSALRKKLRTKGGLRKAKAGKSLRKGAGKGLRKGKGGKGGLRRAKKGGLRKAKKVSSSEDSE